MKSGVLWFNVSLHISVQAQSVAYSFNCEPFSVKLKNTIIIDQWSFCSVMKFYYEVLQQECFNLKNTTVYPLYDSFKETKEGRNIDAYILHTLYSVLYLWKSHHTDLQSKEHITLNYTNIAWSYCGYEKFTWQCHMFYSFFNYELIY